jgi:hypothetical protein
MAAKGIASPVEASLTVPLTVMFCAEAATARSRNKELKNNLAFFISVAIN